MRLINHIVCLVSSAKSIAISEKSLVVNRVLYHVVKHLFLFGRQALDPFDDLRLAGVR